MGPLEFSPAQEGKAQEGKDLAHASILSFRDTFNCVWEVSYSFPRRSEEAEER